MQVTEALGGMDTDACIIPEASFSYMPCACPFRKNPYICALCHMQR